MQQAGRTGVAMDGPAKGDIAKKGRLLRKGEGLGKSEPRRRTQPRGNDHLHWATGREMTRNPLEVECNT